MKRCLMSRKFKKLKKLSKRQRKNLRKLNVEESSSEHCENCGLPMQLRSHKVITAKLLRQPQTLLQQVQLTCRTGGRHCVPTARRTASNSAGCGSQPAPCSILTLTS